MSQNISLLPEHEAAYKQLVDFSRHDPESFRLSAADTYADFSPQDRAITRALETDEITAYAAFNAWHASLKPLLFELEANQLKPSFHKSIARYLVIGTKEAAQKIDELTKQRRHEALMNFVEALYPLPPDDSKDKLSKPRAHAYAFFQLPPKEIEALQHRYVQYLLRYRVAEVQAMTITDAHAPWFKRKHASKKVNVERKRATIYERHRLREISEELAKLSKSYDGLLGKVLEKDWDLIVVIGLRNQYEKKIKALSSDQSHSPLKRLEIFERTTKEFRDQQVEKLALSNSHNSLSAARQVAQTIDALLLQIFDLTNAEKNQLLVHLKEARELLEEQENIIKHRTRRQQVLQKV